MKRIESQNSVMDFHQHLRHLLLGIVKQQSLNVEKLVVDMDIHTILDFKYIHLLMISIKLGKEIIQFFFNKLPNLF